MRTRVLLFAVIVLVTTLTALPAFAAAPSLMNYQGILTDAGGNPITSAVTVVFRIYDQPTGGSALYTENEVVSPDAAGRVNVILGDDLGSITPLNSVFGGAGRWLGITVGGDPELSPRVRLTSVPYAFRVETVDGASGGNLTSDLGVGGTVFVNGTNGVDGVEFPDGTRQTTAATAAGVVYTPGNTFRYTATVAGNQTLTDFVPAVSGPFEARYITGIWITGSAANISGQCYIAGTQVLFLDDHNLGTDDGSQAFWMCGGGAPIVLTGTETMTIIVGALGGSCVVTVTGYDQ